MFEFSTNVFVGRYTKAHAIGLKILSKMNKPVQMKRIFIKWHVSDICIILLWKNITTVIFSNSKRSTPGIIDLEPCEKFWMKVFFAHPKFSEALIIRSFWTEFIRNYFYEYCYNFR